MSRSTKPSSSFWVISVLALIWNLFGVLAYLGQAFMTEEIKAMLPEDQVRLIENTPAWATAAFAVAVWAGILACILLLARKKFSNLLFKISLLGVLVQVGYNVFMTDAFEIYGTVGMIQTGATVLISFFLVWYTNKASADGILN